MKKSLLYISLAVMMAMFTLPSHAIDRKSLVNYAASLKGMKKAELKTAIYNACQPKKVLSYGSGSGSTWSGFSQTDRYDDNKCRDRYSNDIRYFSSANSTSVVSGMNIEHSFPKSWWGGSSNNAYKDLFNLMPCETSINSSKSNYGMGAVTAVNKNNGCTKVGSGMVNGSVEQLWEPADKWKGDFSRGYMYMATIYQNLNSQYTGEALVSLEKNTWPTLKSWAYTLYLQWEKDDRVDQIEVDRNDAVYAIQGNRNLFVDFPYLAEYVWGDSINVAFDPYTSVTTAEDDIRYNTGTPVVTTIATPAFSLEAGTYTENQTVSISCSTAGVSIYYTIDGTTPTSSSTKYNGAITISETTTLKAIAIKNGESSRVKSATYVIEKEQPGGDDDDIADYYFKETFDDCEGTGGNDGLWSGSIASKAFSSSVTDEDTWTATKGGAACQCARFGTGSAQGEATTPSISGMNGKTVTLYFKAAAWNGDETTLLLSATGANLSETSVTLKNCEWTDYQITMTCFSNDVTVTFKGYKTSNSRFFLDEVNIPKEEVETETDIAISAAGYATYYNSKRAYTMPEGVEGYVAFYDEDKWTFENVYAAGDVVPADEALVLKGDKGTYTLKFTTTTNGTYAAADMNDLRGSDTNTVLEDDEDYYFYALTLNAKSELSSVGFYWMNDTGAAFTNGAHKAYLKVYKGMFVGSVANNVKGFAFNDACITGIDSVVAPSEDMPAYNLQGMRVERDAKGFVIVGGKKYYNR